MILGLYSRVDGFIFCLQDALRQLWRLAYPDRQLPALKSEAWKDMGWQGSDPSTDFRCAVISVGSLRCKRMNLYLYGSS